MALKRKLTKEEFDALSKDLQKEYTKDGDNYVLDVEPGDDDDDDDDEDNAGELRRARDREKAEKKRLAGELKEAQDKLKALEKGTSREGKDAATLEKEYNERVEKLEADSKERQEKANKRVADNMINSAADKLAAEISTKPKWLARDIKDRLTVEFDEDGEPELIVKNSKGKNSDMSIEQLRKEMVANKDYADILIGSKASGSATTRKATDQKPGSAVASDDSKPLDLSKMAPKDLAAHLKAQKESSEAN